MIGPCYWTTGMTMHYKERHGWSASIEFYDDGWAGDDDVDSGRISTEGTLKSRYHVGHEDIAAAAVARAVRRDAESLGIRFGGEQSPQLYLHRDNWLNSHTENGGEQIEKTLARVAKALGWPARRQLKETNYEH